MADSMTSSSPGRRPASGGRRADLVKRLAAGRQSVQRAAADNAFYKNDEACHATSDSNQFKLGLAETGTSASTSTSVDRTADLTMTDSLLERTQSHGGLDNNDNDADNDTFGRADAAGGGSSSDGGGMESPNVSPVKKSRAASAPPSVGTPGRPSSPPKVQPPTPGTAAASYALEEQRRQSLERVGSDLTEDDDDDGNITNIYGGGSTYVSDLAVLGAKDANQRPSEVGYATGGKPPTTTGRRVSGSPLTPARRSSPRSGPKSSPKSSPSANRLLASPPKRSRRHVISPHEVGAAAQAAAWAVAGSVDGININASSFPGSPHTAMDASFASAGSSSHSNSLSHVNNGSRDHSLLDDVDTSFESTVGGDDVDVAGVDTSFESIVKEFTLDSSFVREEEEEEEEDNTVEEGGAPDDEVWIDDGLDDLKARARARAKANSKASKQTSPNGMNTSFGSRGSRVSRSSGRSGTVAERIAAVKLEVMEADSRGEWVSFDDDTHGNGDGLSSSSSSDAMLSDSPYGRGGKVWPPPATPNRSPPSSAVVSPITPNGAGVSPIRSSRNAVVGKEMTPPRMAADDGAAWTTKETSPDRSNGDDTASTDGTQRTNNMTPNRIGLHRTPRRSPSRGIVTPSRLTPSRVDTPTILGGHQGVYGISPGRFAAGRHLMDDDNTTIRTDDSYKYMTPQRLRNGSEFVAVTPVKPNTPLGLNSTLNSTPATECGDISFESNNQLNVTADTIQADNTTMSMIFNEVNNILSTTAISEANAVGADDTDAPLLRIDTMEDKSIASRLDTSADSEINSVVREHSTKAGSRVIPGMTRRGDNEACGMFREVEEFFDELAEEMFESFSEKFDQLCVGEDDKRARGEEGSGHIRPGRRSERLTRIVSRQRQRRVNASMKSQCTADSEIMTDRLEVANETFAC